jgi:hypothetical protein
MTAMIGGVGPSLTATWLTSEDLAKAPGSDHYASGLCCSAGIATGRNFSIVRVVMIDFSTGKKCKNP